MSNIHQLGDHPSRERSASEDLRLDQASDWIAKLDRGLTEQEHALLNEWLAESSENTAVLMEVAQMWDKLDELSRLSDLFPETQATERKNVTWYGALAASVLLAIVFSFYQGSYNDFGADEASVVVQQMNYQTDVGESNTINLPDNSKMVLNTDSFVQVRYTSNARIIELLRGEIHIDVAHDKTRPLSVLASGKVIQAVGTAFNVEVRKKLVELIVTDGKVLVAEKDLLVGDNSNQDIDIEKIAKRLPTSSLAISKGEKVDLDLTGHTAQDIIKVDPVELAASLSWRQGNIIFRGESLSEAMAEISRYTDIEFELTKHQMLDQVQVAGMFKTGDVKGLLEVLSNNFNISAQKVGQHKIILSYAG